MFINREPRFYIAVYWVIVTGDAVRVKMTMYCVTWQKMVIQILLMTIREVDI